ncbi:MAG: hypothetical protein U9N84_04830 [Actinomycetota bacterium]|nr:hypothetical protein [Actinomycetota bacterium]
MLKRLFPSRWARIIAWTGAAVAWGTSIVAVQAATELSAVEEPLPPEPIEPQVEEIPAPVAAVPAPTEQGLVVIRYTPVPPPPPEVITRTVTVGGGSTGGGGGGGGTATSSGGGGGGGSTDRPTINSSGS